MDSLEKKRPVDTLTYDNSEEWFYLFQEWTKGEGIDFILRKTAQEYAYLPEKPFNGFGTSTTPSSSHTTTPESRAVRSFEIQDLLESLNITEALPLQGIWDQARLEKWSKAESRMRYILTICVDDIDSKALKEHTTVKTGWEELKAKYLIVRPATAREDQIKLTNYQWEDDQTIDNAWVELKALRRRVVNANPQLEKAYNENMLLQFLLPSLPDDFAITVATLDAQPNLTVQEKLVALRNREDVLRISKAAEDKALAAKESAVPIIGNSIKCKFCHQKRVHDTDNCEFRKAFNDVMDTFTRKQIRRARQSDKRYSKDKGNKNRFSKKSASSDKAPDRTNRRRSSTTDNKPVKNKKRTVKHERGHAAEEDSFTDDSSNNYTTTTDSTDSELVEYAHLTHEEILLCVFLDQTKFGKCLQCDRTR